MGVGEGEAGYLETVSDHVLPSSDGVPAPGHQPLDQLQAEQAEPGHLQDGVWRQSWSPAWQARVGGQQPGETGEELGDSLESLSAGEEILQSVLVLGLPRTGVPPGLGSVDLDRSGQDLHQVLDVLQQDLTGRPVQWRPLLHTDPHGLPQTRGSVRVAQQPRQSVQAVNTGGPPVRQSDPLQQTLLQDPQLEVLAGHHQHDVAQAEVAQQSGALLGWSPSTAAPLDLLEIPSLVQLHPGQRAGVELPASLAALQR